MASLEILLILVVSMLLYIFLPPLLDGIERKIKAKIQTRYGPPTILQTWYDILKLSTKELKMPPTFQFSAFLLVLAFSLSIATIYLLSYIIISLDIYSIALIIVLILSIHSLTAFISTLSSNPFSLIGIFRGLTIDIINEMGFITSIPLYYLSIKTFNLSIKSLLLLILSTIFVFIVSYVASKRLPYDLHEAEPELASGSIIEFSGPILALYLYIHLIDRYTITVLPIAIGLSSIGLSTPLYITMILIHIIAIGIYLLFGVIAPLLGRSRIDIAVKTLMFIYPIIITVWLAVKVL
uniref:Hydrogenase n=1 Tax=Ignisphaera aggregans TaxID=334771 RepID=A0A7C5TJY7_9CREN